MVFIVADSWIASWRVGFHNLNFGPQIWDSSSNGSIFIFGVIFSNFEF